MSTAVPVWAGGWLILVAGLVATAGRIGRARAAAWLVVSGLFLLTVEEPALTFWLGIAGPRADHDGMVGLVTPMARAHVLDSGGYGVAVAVLLGGIALTAFRRGEPWARRILFWGLAVAVVVEVATTVLVFSRGLPLPGPAGSAGQGAFGWQPVAVGLLAWAVGLWLGRAAQPAPTANASVGREVRRAAGIAESTQGVGHPSGVGQAHQPRPTAEGG